MNAAEQQEGLLGAGAVVEVAGGEAAEDLAVLPLEHGQLLRRHAVLLPDVLARVEQLAARPRRHLVDLGPVAGHRAPPTHFMLALVAVRPALLLAALNVHLDTSRDNTSGQTLLEYKNAF